MTIGGFVAVSGLAIATASLAMALAIVGLKVQRTLRTDAWERRVSPYRARVAPRRRGGGHRGRRDPRGARPAHRPDRAATSTTSSCASSARSGANPPTSSSSCSAATACSGRSARDVHSWSPLRRERALHLIGRSRDWQLTDAAISALEDRSPRVRAQAARTVGRVGDPRGAQPLLHALRREGIHSGEAAEALVGMGAGATDALLWALAKGSPRARTVAAHIAGIGGIRAAAPYLVELVERDGDVTVAATAVTALGRVGRPRDVGAIAGATVRYHPQQLRRAAAEALGELGMDQGVPVLVRLLADRESQVSEAAARSLLTLGPTGVAALAVNAHLPTAGAALAHARLTGVAV